MAILIQGGALGVAHATPAPPFITGTGYIQTIAGDGSGTGTYRGDGNPATSEGIAAYNVAVDGAGNVYVANGGSLVQVVAAANETLFGRSMTRGDMYTIASGLNQPSGVAVDSQGNVYIADTNNNEVQVVAAQNGENLFCNGQPSTVDCKVYQSRVGQIYTVASGGGPEAVAVDSRGNLYIADGGYGEIQVLAAADETIFGQTMTAGDIYRIAGSSIGMSGPSTNGVLATSTMLNSPSGVAVDGAGNVYVADTGNNIVQVVAAATGESLFGNTTTVGYIYNIGSGFSRPQGVAVDGAGNVYVADYNNNIVQVVAAASGETLFGNPTTLDDVYTVAGGGGDGTQNGVPALDAGLSEVTGVAVDGHGKVYIADYGQSLVREVTAAPPTVTAVNPSNGTQGTQVTITGTNFTVGAAVYFGTNPATDVSVASPTSITADAPAGSVGTTVDVTVETPQGGTSAINSPADEFAYPPVLTMDLSLSTVVTGGAVTVSGEVYQTYDGNENPISGATVDVTLNGATVSATTDSSGDYSVQLTAPATPASYTVTATSDGTTDSAPLTVQAGQAAGITESVAPSTSIEGGGVTVSGVVSGAGGTPLPGETVDVAVNGGTPVTAVTNGSGDYSAQVAAPMAAGSYAVTATVYGTAVSNSATLQVVAPTPGDIYTIAGDGSSGYTGDGGPAAFATLNSPNDVAVDSAGNVYVADGFNGAVRVVAGKNGTLFGQTMQAGDIYTIVRPAAIQQYGSFIGGVAVDKTGNVFLTVDGEGSGAVLILAAQNDNLFGIQMTAGKLYQIGGNSFGSPEGLAVDAAGNVYVPDYNNNEVYVIAVTDETLFGQNMQAGDTYTIAGNGTGGYSGDGGPAAQAELYEPDGVALDSAGNLYIADMGNNVIRVVAAANETLFGQQMTAGDIYTVAGSAKGAGYTGDGGPATSAQLNYPSGVALDSAGNLYIADYYNNAVRVVAGKNETLFGQTMTAGDIYTVAGSATGASGYSGDGGPAAAALLDGPSGVAIGAGGNLYIADENNNVVRMVAGAAPTATGTATAVTLGVSPESVRVDGQVQVSGTVTGTGGPMDGAMVELGLSSGSGNVGSLSSTTVTTDVYGDYSAVFTAPAQSGAVTVTATVYGTVYQDQAVILVTPQAATVDGASEVAATGGAATASYGDTSESGTGTGVLSVAQYGGNPTGTGLSGAVRYFDAALSTGNTFQSVTVTECGATAGDTLYWFNPAADGGAGGWQAVSPAATYDAGCLDLTVTANTSPSLSEMDGTVLALAAPQSTSGSSGSFGGGSVSINEAAPVVTGISPATGTAGTTVTIDGSGFTGATAVDFGPNAAQSFSVVSDGEITAVAPTGTGTVDVTVATAGGTSATGSADQFTYQATPCTASFSDVPASYWAYKDILTLACKGIIAGFPDGTFRPDASVTRAQFVTMLVRTLGLKLGTGNTPFMDVTPTAWYAPYVAAAQQDGIVAGISPTEFGPNEPITREEMAVLLAHALGSSAVPGSPLKFTDTASIASWAQAAVQEVVGAGLMAGFPNGTFQPTGVSTRAQAAAVLAQYLAYSAQK